jgi:cation transport ATPase
VPLEEIAVADVLPVVVPPGNVLPVGGTVGPGVAVLDESALTGEAVRSGTPNAAGPFGLRATTSAAALNPATVAAVLG